MARSCSARELNDGPELERSIRDLSAYLPHLQSVSIVPVGLTKYREGLYPMVPFTKEEARAVTALVHDWQEKLYARSGEPISSTAVMNGTCLSEEDMPPAETYDGYLQLENGVGMTRLLLDEVA